MVVSGNEPVSLVSAGDWNTRTDGARHFFSARGFGSRAEMLEAVIDHTTLLSPQQLTFLKEAVKKARQYSGFRNKIAHGESVLSVIQGPAPKAFYVIVQSKNVPSDDVISIQDMSLAIGNFQTLHRCINSMLPWLRERNQTLKSPEECLALVLALPNEPHSKSDPTAAASAQQPRSDRPNKKAYRAEQAAKKARSGETQ
jgi:hypothetical protein